MLLQLILALASFGATFASQWTAFTPVGVSDAVYADAYTYIPHPVYPDYGARVKRTDWCDHTVKSGTLVPIPVDQSLTFELREVHIAATSTWARDTYSSTSSRAEVSLTEMML